MSNDRKRSDRGDSLAVFSIKDPTVGCSSGVDCAVKSPPGAWLSLREKALKDGWKGDEGVQSCGKPQGIYVSTQRSRCYPDGHLSGKDGKDQTAV